MDNIEVGDTVQLKQKNSQIFGAILVIEIRDNVATCAFSLLDKPMDGDERPVSFQTATDKFSLDSLVLLVKGHR